MGFYVFFKNITLIHVSDISIISSLDDLYIVIMLDAVFGHQELNAKCNNDIPKVFTAKVTFHGLLTGTLFSI